VELSSPVSFQGKRSAGQLKPGTIRLPEDVSVFVMRLSNAVAGLNNVNRVQDEVATMSIFRAAVSHISTHLVPEVYGWASAAKGQGWILQEHMPGSSQDKAFATMTLQDKQLVLRQLAEVLEALQRYQLPDTIKDYGGLGFDGVGHIVSAPMTLVHGGPFQSYETLYREILHSQLAAADQSSLEGWRSNGVRKRLDLLLVQRLDQVIR
jgi:Phosphotransferase enzyme family